MFKSVHPIFDPVHNDVIIIGLDVHGNVHRYREEQWTKLTNGLEPVPSFAEDFYRQAKGDIEKNDKANLEDVFDIISLSESVPDIDVDLDDIKEAIKDIGRNPPELSNGEARYE